MTDIVEKLTIWPAADGADALAGHFVEALMQEAAAEITKLRAERDAAARDMRERAASLLDSKVASLQKVQSWQTKTPLHNELGIVIGYIIGAAVDIRALPISAAPTDLVIATSGKDAT